MGVRGKIEAVIYAAEEPITLAQLTALFGEEALTEAAAQAEPATDPESLAPEADSIADSQEDAAPQGGIATEATTEAEGQPERTRDEPYQAEGEPTLLGDPDADKRAARLRDRQARAAVQAVLQALMADYGNGERGMEIREIAGGYRVATKPEYHDAVRAFVKSLKPPMKLSLQALETLAVISYKQPITAPEVSEIRGVDSAGVLGSLISRKLVTTAGRKQVVGRPILYKTTKEFLLRFGLKDLAELPSMEEFEKMASELESLGDEPETAPLLAEEAADREPVEEPGPPAPAESAHPHESAISMDAEEPELPGIQVQRGGLTASDNRNRQQVPPEPTEEA